MKLPNPIKSIENKVVIAAPHRKQLRAPAKHRTSHLCLLLLGMIFSVTVAYGQTISNNIADQTLLLSNGASTLDLSSVFTDAVSYSGTSNSPSIAMITVSNNTATLTPVANGLAIITVTATGSGNGSTVTQRFNLRVVSDCLLGSSSFTGGLCAVAGPDQTVDGGDLVTLDGSASYGVFRPSGLTYTWTQSGGTPTVSLSGGNTANRTFTAPQEATTLTFGLLVSDGEGEILSGGPDLVNITVNAPDAPPSFGTKTVTAQTYIVGSAITALTLPVASGGNGSLTYSLTALPAGLTFDTDTRIISGMPTTPATTAPYTLTATDTANDTATLTFSITVNAPDDPLSFSTVAVPNQTYTVGTAITPLPLSLATGGNGRRTYTLTPDDLPAGLTFNTSTYSISGTPRATATMSIYTLTATDADDNTATLMFNITVNPSVTLSGNIRQLNESILPRLIHDMVASTVVAVGNRIDATFSGKAQVASYQLDGQTVQLDAQSSLSANLRDTLQMKLPSYIKSLKDGAMDWKQMLSNSSFVLPLDATAGDGAGDAGVTVWGSGNYSKLSDKNDKALDWEGDVFSIQLGIDGRARDGLLVGGLVSWSKGDVGYALLSGERGDYKHTLTSVHPYLAWSSGDGINLWSSVGYGQGKLEKNQSNSDTKVLSLAAGVKDALPQVAGLSVKSDIALVQIDIDESADSKIPKQNLASQQFRWILESKRQRTLASGGTITPVLELGLRYDAGDGGTGVGVVLGAGARYANTTGLSIEGKVHALVGQNNYEEWGVQGMIHQTANADGRGLSFSLSPRYGHAGSNASQVWNQNLPVGDGNKTDDYTMQVKARLGYGMFAPGGGLLTPYSEITVGDQSRNYRLGIHWNPDSPFNLHLLGERKESSSGIDTHRVLLESIIRF